MSNTINTSLLAMLLLTVMLLVQVALMSLWMSGLPNSFLIPPFEHFAFYSKLWHDSPVDALKLWLLDKPLLVIEQRSVDPAIQVWGLYIYAWNLLLQLTFSIYLAISLALPGRNRLLGWRITGIILLLATVVYVRRADCCVGGPGWWIEVWLLSRLLDPMSAVDWGSLYMNMRTWLVVPRLLMAMAGVGLLYLARKIKPGQII
jgi:hypothetical protein